MPAHTTSAKGVIINKYLKLSMFDLCIGHHDLSPAYIAVHVGKKVAARAFYGISFILMSYLIFRVNICNSAKFNAQ